MGEMNLVEELRKRGFKLTPLPSLTLEQMKRIQKVSRDVKNFLKTMDEANKASTKSTLRFSTSYFVARHGQRRGLPLNTQKQR